MSSVSPRHRSKYISNFRERWPYLRRCGVNRDFVAHWSVGLHVESEIGRQWAAAGLGQVIGITVSQSARNTLAAGVPES